MVANSLKSEGTTGRALTYGVGTIPGAQMTVALCTAACKTAGYTLAGVEYSGECCKSSELVFSDGSPLTWNFRLRQHDFEWSYYRDRQWMHDAVQRQLERNMWWPQPAQRV